LVIGFTEEKHELKRQCEQESSSFWAIADKLTGVYKPHEYGEVILPMTVIRRSDCILADTRQAVWDKYESVKTLPMKDVFLIRASGHSTTPANTPSRNCWTSRTTSNRQ